MGLPITEHSILAPLAFACHHHILEGFARFTQVRQICAAVRLEEKQKGTMERASNARVTCSSRAVLGISECLLRHP